jgi:hypothetical protein
MPISLQENKKEMQVENLGVKVIMKWKTGETIICRNVTEIHFAYPPFHDSIAFESDIHTTGRTDYIKSVLEFETEPEVEKQLHFWEE